MSFGAAQAALELRLDDVACKAVLFGLSNHTKIDSECFPGIKTLMLYTGLSERAVRDAVGRLEDLGYLRVVRRKDPNHPTRNLTSLYYLDIEKMKEAAGKPERKAKGSAAAADKPDSIIPSNASGYPADGALMQELHHPVIRDARGFIPEDWKPTEQLIERCMKEFGLGEQVVKHEATLFVLKNTAAGTQVANIDAAFRGWCARVQTLNHKPKQASQSAATDLSWSRADRIAKLEADIERYTKWGKLDEAKDAEEQLRKLEQETDDGTTSSG